MKHRTIKGHFGGNVRMQTQKHSDFQIRLRLKLELILFLTHYME